LVRAGAVEMGRREDLAASRMASAVFVQMDVGAGREESQVMGRFLAQVAGCVVAGLACRGGPGA
jgi:hypothetical protein